MSANAYGHGLTETGDREHAVGHEGVKSLYTVSGDASIAGRMEDAP